MGSDEMWEHIAEGLGWSRIRDVRAMLKAEADRERERNKLKNRLRRAMFTKCLKVKH